MILGHIYGINKSQNVYQGNKYLTTEQFILKQYYFSKKYQTFHEENKELKTFLSRFFFPNVDIIQSDYLSSLWLITGE